MLQLSLAVLQLDIGVVQLPLVFLIFCQTGGVVRLTVLPGLQGCFIICLAVLILLQTVLILRFALLQLLQGVGQIGFASSSFRPASSSSCRPLS